MEMWQEINEIKEGACDIVDGFSSWNYSWHLPKDKYGYIKDEACFKLLNISLQHLAISRAEVEKYENLIVHLKRATEYLRRQEWEKLEDAEYWYPYYMAYQAWDTL